MSAFISQIYGQKLVKEVVHLLLAWEGQVHIHAGENGAVSPHPPTPRAYQSDLPCYSRRAPSLHLALSALPPHQRFLSARLQVCGAFQTLADQCGLTDDVFRRALTLMKRSTGAALKTHSSESVDRVYVCVSVYGEVRARGTDKDPFDVWRFESSERFSVFLIYG